MFDSLDDTMKQDGRASTSMKERALVWLAVGVVSIALFGGLYFGVQFLG
jgi:hypothetical protein